MADQRRQAGTDAAGRQDEGDGDEEEGGGESELEESWGRQIEVNGMRDGGRERILEGATAGDCCQLRLWGKSPRCAAASVLWVPCAICRRSSDNGCGSRALAFFITRNIP